MAWPEFTSYDNRVIISPYESWVYGKGLVCPKEHDAFTACFCQTTLLRHFQEAAAERLSSQLFWNQINRILETSCAAIRRDIFQGAVQREGLSLESICYDGTNFYTLIDAFNAHCHLPRRGKNQQDFALIDSCDPSLQA